MRKKQTNPNLPKQFYTIYDELGASKTKPLSLQRRDRHLSPIHASLENLATGASPTLDNVGYISDAVNLLDTAVNMRFNERGTEFDAIEYPTEEIQEASDAVGRCVVRQRTTGVYRFDAQGLSAVRNVVEFYSDLLEILPERIFIKIHRKTVAQTIDALKGKLKSPNLKLVEV